MPEPTLTVQQRIAAAEQQYATAYAALYARLDAGVPLLHLMVEDINAVRRAALHAQRYSRPFPALVADPA